MKSFEELQAGLGAAWSLNKPGSGAEHVLVSLPSYTLGDSLKAHYQRRIPALEHRYLLATLLLARITSCELVALFSVLPDPELVDYYIDLLPRDTADSVRSRLRIVVVPGTPSRSLAANLARQPALMAALRASFANRPAFIEPWNVTDDEIEVARHLDAPIYGTSPAQWPLGYKSAGRRLFAAAGVPVVPGHNDLRSVDDVVGAGTALKAADPLLHSLVVKLDNSGAGDGNMVIDLVGDENTCAALLRDQVSALPAWYLRELEQGGVAEALIEGPSVSSPSVQLEISPYGDVQVLSTHEQVLSGERRQVYDGCRFPANPSYAPDLADYGQTIGRHLVREGAVGRISVDFMARADTRGHWKLYALEINLRMGGTTPPFTALRHLVPGHYDLGSSRWQLLDGSSRYYCATDNLMDQAWLGLPAQRVIRAVEDADLGFDQKSATGVVLHMLSGLAIDGRFGLTAIGATPGHAAGLYEATKVAVTDGAHARRPVAATRSPI